MKRVHLFLAAVAIVALSTAAFAGEGHECTASAQECLNKMAASFADYGWTGLEGDYDAENGVFTITEVVAMGPAAHAGLKVGDILFGINGHKFAEMKDEDWKAMKSARMPGKTVTYMAKADGKKKMVDLVLVAMPEDVVATKIGKHMVDHAEVASVQ